MTVMKQKESFGQLLCFVLFCCVVLCCVVLVYYFLLRINNFSKSSFSLPSFTLHPDRLPDSSARLPYLAEEKKKAKNQKNPFLSYALRDSLRDTPP